jgi:hypothetical protein
MYCCQKQLQWRWMPPYLENKQDTIICCKDITSPMSTRATMWIPLSSRREDGSLHVSNRAHNAQNDDARLSSLLANTNSPRAPPTQRGHVSYTFNSKSATSITSQLSSSANTCNSFQPPSLVESHAWIFLLDHSVPFLFHQPWPLLQWYRL